jgi:uncharacterized protein YndB with AHSA1/START domain
MVRHALPLTAAFGQAEASERRGSALASPTGPAREGNGPMNKTATETRSVVIEREIAFPPEKIWRALTQPQLIEEWLMKNDFKAVAGHRFNLRREPKPDVSIAIDCRVLEIEPNRTLSYTWDAYGLESVVTFTLVPTSTGTRLRMEQSGFRPDQPKAFHGARAGWQQFLASLETLLARTD